MSESGFALGDGKFPDAADAGRACSGLERWQEAVARTGDPDLQAAAANLLGDGASRQLLNSVFGNSSFLTLCAEQEPAFTVSLFTDGPDASCRRIMDSVSKSHKKRHPAKIRRDRFASQNAGSPSPPPWPISRRFGHWKR